jgi:ankyrin repeat protein
MTKLTSLQIIELQSTYRDLVNYQSVDACEPISPLTYRTADNDRLIHIAAYRGDLQSVEMLLDAGEDIDAIGDMGLTPAHYAAMGRHRHVFDLIISRGGDAAITDEFGNTAEETWASLDGNGAKRSDI